MTTNVDVVDVIKNANNCILNQDFNSDHVILNPYAPNSNFDDCTRYKLASEVTLNIMYVQCTSNYKLLSLLVLITQP